MLFLHDTSLLLVVLLVLLPWLRLRLLQLMMMLLLPLLHLRLCQTLIRKGVSPLPARVGSRNLICAEQRCIKTSFAAVVVLDP